MVKMLHFFSGQHHLSIQLGALTIAGQLKCFCLNWTCNFSRFQELVPIVSGCLMYSFPFVGEGTISLQIAVWFWFSNLFCEKLGDLLDFEKTNIYLHHLYSVKVFQYLTCICDFFSGHVLHNSHSTGWVCGGLCNGNSIFLITWEKHDNSWGWESHPREW